MEKAPKKHGVKTPESRIIRGSQTREGQIRHYSKQLAVCFLLTLLILGFLIALTVWIGESGESEEPSLPSPSSPPPPTFPFQNAQQLEGSLPGLESLGYGIFLCHGQPGGVRFVHGTGTNRWVTYLARSGERFVTAYFPNLSTLPAYLWIGRADLASGRMSVDTIRLFDPTDSSPCSIVSPEITAPKGEPRLD